jgi:hypothetical protein
MSGLDMRQRDGLLKGGKRGSAISPGKPAVSLLYLSATHQDTPCRGDIPVETYIRLAGHLPLTFGNFP